MLKAPVYLNVFSEDLLVQRTLVRLMTYLSTDQNHLSGASGHRFCRTRISIILYLYTMGSEPVAVNGGT